MKTTLLITIHNRADLLRNSLSRLTELTLPDEVLIVDDGGGDATEQVCAQFADRLPITYLYHDNPGRSICSFARNVGLRQSTGDLLITSEPEVIFDTDVIAQFLALHDEHPNDVISAGRIRFLDQQGEVRQDAIGWVATYAALYDRLWLYEVGGWDEGFPGPWGWDDTDLLTRLRLAGHGQHIAREIEVSHQPHRLGGDPGSQNERYFFSKSFHGGGTLDRSDVVANRGRSWGQWRPRTATS